MTNTQTSFYALWSREQLVAELVRMNQLLNDMDVIISAQLEKRA